MSSDEPISRVPSQERAIRTRASLVSAAKEEFSTRGYASATAKSIAERAGVSTGSFYQYFRDKDQVLYELASERYARVGKLVAERFAIEPGPAEARGALVDGLRVSMRQLVEIVIEFHREDPGLHAVLTERRHADPGLDSMTGLAETALVSQIADLLRLLGRHDDVEALSFVLFGMVEGSVHAHVLGKPVVDDARLVEALVASLVSLVLG